MSTHASRRAAPPPSRLQSPRFIRTVSWISGLVLVAGIVAFAIAYFGDTAEKVNVAPTGAAAPTPRPDPTVPLDPKARLAAGKFVTSNVTRQNLELGWKLTHPELKAGFTHKQWLSGNIPVQYYPPKAIAGASFKVEESHPREVVLDLLIFPKKGSGLNPQAFYVGLKAVGNGKNKQWLVYTFVPHGGVEAQVPSLGQ
jgi:hypothetical protein